MNAVESPVLFDCEGDRLVGVLSLPERPLDVGVLVVVGGPQYRVGSHRQFVQLARALAKEGVPSLRFDYRGMGDSEGAPRPFDAIDADIACAAKELRLRAPSVRKIVLWGLCDGASAALMALRSLPTVEGVIAINPWVRTETSLDQTLVKHYYMRRILTRDFWTKLINGKIALAAAASEFFGRFRSALTGLATGAGAGAASAGNPLRFQDRMREGLAGFKGRVLFVLSGRDLTAQEYMAFASSDSRWKALLADDASIATRVLPAADHTFSSRIWREEVERLSCDFVLSLRSPAHPVSSKARP